MLSHVCRTARCDVPQDRNFDTATRTLNLTNTVPTVYLCIAVVSTEFIFKHYAFFDRNELKAVQEVEGSRVLTAALPNIPSLLGTYAVPWAISRRFDK